MKKLGSNWASCYIMDSWIIISLQLLISQNDVCVRACVRTCVCVRACVCVCVFFLLLFFFLQNSTSLATTNRKYIFKNVCTALIGSGKETAVTH